ncbi:hypothetical protein [Kocuria sp.]|uniref:hypothetical protein n=1 Tax=Kocuria sp. TaxID=1871328 RepID=UPI0026DBDE57|nr:hypothetical protein [Kocuria sp.]MDO4920075.1 hypothetical protein [Kocuria sp.]
MTILPPPRPAPRHECEPLDNPYEITRPLSALGTLWECPDCGRWWKYREQYQGAKNSWRPRYEWAPVSAWDVKARRRIAAHETEKMHYRVPTATGTLHWWDCHPNPRRKP